MGSSPGRVKPKTIKLAFIAFFAKHAALRRKSKDWMARYQNNVYECSDMSTHWLLFQWPSTIKIQLCVLVKYKVDFIIISLKLNLFSPWYSWKIAELSLNNNHSFNFFHFIVESVYNEYMTMIILWYTLPRFQSWFWFPSKIVECN
jgi:hypothetical protein